MRLGDLIADFADVQQRVTYAAHGPQPAGHVAHVGQQRQQPHGSELRR